METLFPIVVERKPDPPPEPCLWPYFLVAYWPRKRLWKIDCYDHYQEEDDPQIARDIRDLRDKGWTHVTVMRLPEKLWRVEP